jgi:chromosome segregation ATPase
MTPKDWIAPGVIVAIMTVWLILSGGRFASIDNQYADIAARLTELDAKLDRSMYGISATENQHGDITKRITELEAKLDRSINSIPAAESQHGDIAKRLAELDAKLERYISGSSSSKDNQYADIARRITDLAATVDRNISSLSGRLDSVGQQQAALASQLGGMLAELNALKRRLESLADKSEKNPGEPGPQPPATSPGD